MTANTPPTMAAPTSRATVATYVTAASGAMLLAASVLPGLARADEPAAVSVVLDPTSGSLTTPVKVKASGPCPTGSVSYTLLVSGVNAPGFLWSTELPPGGVPDTTAGAVPALPLFDDNNPPVDGGTYVLHINCTDAANVATELTSITLKVTGTQWAAEGPATPPPTTGPTGGTPTSSEPPTSQPPTSQPPTSQPPTSQPPTGTATASVSPASAAPGALVQVALAGFGPAEIVDRELRPASGSSPAPVALPPQAMGADGSGTAPAQIPANTTPGAYKLVFTGPDTGRTAEAALTVTGTTNPPTSQPPTTTPPTSTAPPTATDTATATRTPTGTATETTPGTTDGGNSGGGNSGGSDGGSGGGTSGGGGGGLAHTGAVSDPRLLGTLGAALMVGSGAVWYRTRRRSELLEADGQE